MLYIHQATCISPQATFADANIEELQLSADNKLKAIEPAYTGIPPGQLRRMGKAVRMGVGAALALLQNVQPQGIIIGTANGAMEESGKFMKQIIDYQEDMLTPGNFVQSTSNAIASQISLLTQNKGYNSTHIHRGLSFENAVIDALMFVNENPGFTCLLGAVDEISTYNHHIDYLDGWFKKEKCSNIDLYTSDTAGSIAGEGAAIFLVSDKKENAVAELKAIATIHSTDITFVQNELRFFVEKHLPNGQSIDLLMTGENGDNRALPFYLAAEALMDKDTLFARFKHMSGEYATAASFALWLVCKLLHSQVLPGHIIKRKSAEKSFQNVLIYNNHKLNQHSFMLVSRPVDS